MTDEEWREAHAIEAQAREPVEMALALLLLTSPLKVKRERGKEMVRGWKKGAILSAHYRPGEIQNEKSPN